MMAITDRTNLFFTSSLNLLNTFDCLGLSLYSDTVGFVALFLGQGFSKWGSTIDSLFLLQHVVRKYSMPGPLGRLSPKVIEYRDVSTLRQQVRDVRTPRFSLNLRPASAADLQKIQHLTVTQQNPAGTPAETTGQPVTPPPASTHGGKAGTKRSHSCQRCGLSAASLAALIEHLHTAHAGRRWCRRCRSEFPSGQPVSEHRQHCRRAALEGQSTPGVMEHWRRVV